MRALVLEDQNYTAALSIVRALGALGHVAVTVAPYRSPAAFSRWCAEAIIGPRASDRACYADFVLSLLRRNDYDIGFTCTDTVIDIVSAMRAGLPARPDFLLPSEPVLAIASSKFAAQQFATALGLPTVRTIAPESAEQLDAVARQFEFPVVVKGDKGSGGSHVQYASNPDELRRAYRETAASSRLGQPLVQEFIPGNVYLTHVLYDRGQLVAICSHLKERYFPASGGITARAVTVHEPQLDEQVARVFSALHWHGPAKADFKRDARDGLFKLMELDPRISASIAIPCAAGVDMVEMCCQMAAGEPVSPKLNYAEGIRVRYVCRDTMCLAAQPSLLLSYLLDTFNPRIRSNFDWRDLPGTVGLIWRGKWALEDAWAKGEIVGEHTGTVGRRNSRFRTALHRALLLPIVAGLRVAGLLYRGARFARRHVGVALGHTSRAAASLAPGRRGAKGI